MDSAKKKSNDFFDINNIISLVRRKWYVFAASVFVFMVVGFLYARKMQPNFSVVANVLIDDGKTSKMPSLGDFSSLFSNGGDVDDEVFIISSHAVYTNVVKNLDLNISHYVKTGFLKTVFAYKEYPVQVYLPDEMSDTLRHGLRFDVVAHTNGKVDVEMYADKDRLAEVENKTFPITMSTPYGQFIIDKTVDFPEKQKKDIKTSIGVLGYSIAAESLAQQVKSSIANKRANVINLGIITTSPAYGVDVLNETINEYNKRGIEESNAKNLKTAKFVDDRLAMLSDSIAISQNEIRNYMEQSGINDLAGDAEYNYKMKGETEARLIKAQTESEILRLAKEFIENPDNAYEVMPASVNDSQGLTSAIATYNQLVLKRIQIMNNAKESNTALRQLNEQIDAMRASITTSINKAYDNAIVVERDLRREVSKASDQLSNKPRQSLQLSNLFRNNAVKNELYLYLLKMREETAMMIANALPKAQIIDEAYVKNGTVGMSKKVVYVAFFLLGLGAPLGWYRLRKMLKDNIETRHEIESMTDIPILGEVAKEKGESKLVVNSGNHSTNAELFRLLRANLQFMARNKSCNVVLVTSTSPGEGKSFISVNLAATIAMMNKRVLLVGMDIRKPMLANYLGISVDKGLTNYISSHDVEIDDIINHYAPVPNLDVIVGGPIPPNPAELLTSERVDELFDELRDRYDYIIVDTAPVGMVADTFSLSRLADATVYVTRIDVTKTKDIDFINQIEDTERLKNISLVINGSLKTKGYGYGYGHHTDK